ARGDIAGMASALSLGVAVDQCDSLGRTALIFALQRARAFSRVSGPHATPDSIRFLLESGASVEREDSLGMTALHHAAEISDPVFSALILQHGGNARHITKSGYTVPLNACFQPAGSAKREILKRLHHEGADLNLASEYGESLPGVCLRFGDFETLRFLLELGANMSFLHWTETHRLVALESVDALRSFAPTQASINAKSPRQDLSPWLLSMIRGDVEIIQWLAESGADLTQRGWCGVSCLHLACEFGHAAAARWLMDLGAVPEDWDDFGGTPLCRAVEADRVGCASALLERGAKAAYEERSVIQPMASAVSLAMLKVLVEKGGADVNALDGCGDWPLKNAADRNDVESIRWLLENGAEVDRTSTGETALHTAVQSDAREAVGVLLAAGANPNAQDVDGWTPLFNVQSIETIEMLLNAGADRCLADQIGSGPERWIKDGILRKALKP
ncbi:MAG TPA: ankyrin repeat domain-containing protein, partial [Roseimicrobium sp.]|nr:ankyrin repeat domain-containing protein [Roseimicrobium sp.]